MPDFQPGWALTPGSPPTLVTTGAPTAFNPFGTGGVNAELATTTAQDIIDSARIRHHAFSDIEMPDGAAVLFLNQRQRDLLALGGADIDGLVGTGLQYTILTPTTGVLSTFVNGVSAAATPGQDGWVTHLDENDVPYIDQSEPMIAGDPLGDTPGFPLPAEMVRLINVMLLTRDGRLIPADVVQQRARNTALPGRNPQMYIAGNRLMPMRRFDAGSAQNTADRWQEFVGIQLSYVAIERVTALTDAITLPTVLVGALIADLAQLFAMQSKLVSPAEKAMFRDEAAKARAEFLNAANGLTHGASTTTVRYRG